jgi:hypothetical protein
MSQISTKLLEIISNSINIPKTYQESVKHFPDSPTRRYWIKKSTLIRVWKKNFSRHVITFRTPIFFPSRVLFQHKRRVFVFHSTFFAFFHTQKNIENEIKLEEKVCFLTLLVRVNESPFSCVYFYFYSVHVCFASPWFILSAPLR